MSIRLQVLMMAVALAAVPALAQDQADVDAAASAADVAHSVLPGASEIDLAVAQVPGSAAAVVGTVEATAVIQAIDSATREITLQTQDGRTETLVAGPGVVHFDQLAAGDTVRVTYKEAVVVYLGGAETANAEAGAGLVRESDVPGGKLLGAGQVTVKVLELDKETRKAKLELPGGEIRAVQVRDGLDLSQVEVGDTVTVAIAKALAVSVEKPAAD